MAVTARKRKALSGGYLGRDVAGWRVRVPCPGGHGYFPFGEHGGVQKALTVARAFQEEALCLLESDRAYQKKHGEPMHREVLHMNNKTGITGVSRTMHPNLWGDPRIVWTASWSRGNYRQCQSFSTSQYNTEDEAKDAAIEMRARMHKPY